MMHGICRTDDSIAAVRTVHSPVGKIVGKMVD